MLEENKMQPMFIEAEQSWDLGRLYKDLAGIKGKHLSPMEKIYLKGLLLGQSPTRIAEVLHKNPKGVEVDLSKTLYQYVKDVLDRSEEKIENWREIKDWLEDAGYRKSFSSVFDIHNITIANTNFSIEKLQFSIEKIQIERIKSENNKIAIDVSVRFISNPESEKDNSK